MAPYYHIWISVIICALGTVVNYICFLHYNMRYDTKNGLFYIFALDSGLTALATLAETVILFILAIYQESSPLLCFNLQMVVSVILTFGPVLYFVSSFIR